MPSDRRLPRSLWRGPLRAWLVAGLSAAALAGCNAGSEAAFTSGRAYDPCIQVLPACPSLVAACVLDETRYTRRSFPGDFRFLVRADPEAKIEVLIFLAEQRDAGMATLIDWNEPGCADVYRYDSEGRNLFQEVEDTHLITKKQSVYEGGEHLIQIISDMQAKVDISVQVHEADSGS
jgi:hypothetical protein